jgi:beta-lactamase superfamily II metal-dependent hydrolase
LADTRVSNSRFEKLLKILRLVFFLIAIAAAASADPLRMFFIDVEGGQATLIVSPTGQSMLIDTGWPGFGGRDADRIVSAAKHAGLDQLDYVLVTHFHIDHVGGLPQLAAKIKIGTFIDHGPDRENSEDTRTNFAAYQKAIQGAKRLIVKPGDHIPMTGLGVEVVSADGETIHKPLAGAGPPNPLCATEPKPEDDPTENSRSVGVLITYGKLRVLDLGDLTKKKELALACPNNLLGNVDLFVVTHHGFNASGSRALVHAIHPRVAIMDNGAHKGGSPDYWQTVHEAPGLSDLWQLHTAQDSDKEHSAAPDFIANLEENCQGKSISVTADEKGTVTVKNDRNGFTKTYKAP